MAAKMASFVYTVTRVVKSLNWVDDEAMAGLRHVTGRIDEEDDPTLFTSIGFFIEAKDEPAFKIGEQYEMPECPLRVMAYHRGGANRRPVIVERGMGIELLTPKGTDLLAGQDYYIPREDRPRGGNTWGRPAGTEVKQAKPAPTPTLDY